MTTAQKTDGAEYSAAIRQAAKEWIGRFTDIPRSIVIKLYESGDNILEITPRDPRDCDTSFPMWGTMWGFNNSVDSWWLDDKKNLQAMAKCGFRIYIQEDYDYIFGIDSAGYDFYESHWIPLYLARGLKWHEVSPSGK